MSTPTPEPTNGPAPEDQVPGHADMLADLDALLERMMALPVSQADEGEPRPVRRSEAPPDDVPIITVTEAVAHTEAPPPPAPAVSTAPDDLYFKALLARQSREPVRPPEPVVFHRPPLAPPAEPPASYEPVPSYGVSRPSKSASPPRGPLAWINRLFDATTSPLGGPGRWLRGKAGRSLLGWSGLLMIVAVAGLAVWDCLGWTW